MGDEPIDEAVETASDQSARGKLDLDIYSIKDVCARLDLNYLTVIKAVKTLKLRAIKIGGSGGFRVMHEDVIDWLDEMATKPRKTSSPYPGLKIRL